MLCYLLQAGPADCLLASPQPHRRSSCLYLSLRCLRQRMCCSLLPIAPGWVYLSLPFRLAAGEWSHHISFLQLRCPYSSGLPPHFTLVSAQTSPPQRSLLEPSLPPHPALFCFTALLLTYSFIYLVWSVSSWGHVAPQRQGHASSTAVRSNLHFTDRKTRTRPGTERVFMVQGPFVK